MAVPYTFGTATAAIPLSQLDTNFATAITLGNTAVYLGNTTTSIGNLTLTNVTISSGSVTITDTTVSGNVTLSGGTANGVAYLNGSKVLTSGSALVFDGASLGLSTTPSAWSGSYRALQSGSGSSFVGFNGNDQTFVVSNAYNDGSWKYKNTAGAGYYAIQGVSSGVHAWFTAPSGTAGNAITFTQAMTLTAAGNLGIGSTGPVSKLEVSNSGVAGLIIGYNNTSNNYYDSNTHYFRAGNSSTEYARIDSSGNLLVGTTSGGGAGGLTVYPLGGGAGTAAIQVFNKTNTTSDYALQFRVAGTTVSGISYTSTVVTYGTVSDYRLKTVIGAVTDSGNRIDALEPIEYTWNSNGQRTRGFLAHKFQEVYASSVTGTKDAVDADGNPIHQGMQAGSTEVIADLVAEIQSLRKRLTALEGKA